MEYRTKGSGRRTGSTLSPCHVLEHFQGRSGSLERSRCSSRCRWNTTRSSFLEHGVMNGAFKILSGTLEEVLEEKDMSFFSLADSSDILMERLERVPVLVSFPPFGPKRSVPDVLICRLRVPHLAPLYFCCRCRRWRCCCGRCVPGRQRTFTPFGAFQNPLEEIRCGRTAFWSPDRVRRHLL